MIKFRCPRCTQKIAVNDEGAGVEISCPTCTEKIVVPPQSTPEFQPVTEILCPRAVAAFDSTATGSVVRRKQNNAPRMR